MKRIYSVLMMVGLVWLTGCNKDEDHVKLLAPHVVQTDCSPPTDGEIVAIDVHDKDTVFVAALEDTVTTNPSLRRLKMFFTTNGGQSWTSIPSPVELVQNVNGMAFFNQYNGAVILDKIARITKNEGYTWGSYSLELMLCMGRTSNNDIYFIQDWGGSINFDIFQLLPDNYTPQVVYNYNAGDSYFFKRGVQTGNYLYLFENAPCYSYHLEGIDLTTFQEVSVVGMIGNCYNDVTSLTNKGGRILLTRKDGWEYTANFHDDPESTDYMCKLNAGAKMFASDYLGNGVYIAGGEGILACNHKGMWQHIYTVGSKNFPYTFKFLKNVGNNSFYAACDDGSLFRYELALPQ